jgi:hypothetical protein
MGVLPNSPLHLLLREARSQGRHLVGTSANFAGDPTIIHLDLLECFMNSLAGVQKVFLNWDGSGGSGVDSASILRPVSGHSADVLRKAIDFKQTAAAFAQAGFTLTDAPDCSFTKIAEERRVY